jgi:hypothetical protein
LANVWLENSAVGEEGLGIAVVAVADEIVPLLLAWAGGATTGGRAVCVFFD